jgi:hypothetical protein
LIGQASFAVQNRSRVGRFSLVRFAWFSARLVEFIEANFWLAVFENAVYGN